MITREYFANYKYLESRIKSMRRRITYFERHPLSGVHGVVKGSMSGYPFAECHFVISAPSIKSAEERNVLINQLSIDLAGNLLLFEDMKLDIEEFIENSELLNMEEQTIFRLKYIENWSYEKIGDTIGYDKSAVSRKIDKVLERIDSESDKNEISSKIR